MPMNYDFAGWATKYNIRCTDGRIIRDGAFKAQHKAKIPLIYGHNINDVDAVLGHAYLEHRDGEGVWAYGVFNDTEAGQIAKKCVQHGDLDTLSIRANHLEPKHSDEVVHGKIQELSLVFSGANSGARIEIVHGDSDEDATAWIFSDEQLELAHEDSEIPEELLHEEKGEADMADNKPESKKERTVQDVIDSMNEEQKAVLFGLLEEMASKNSDEAKHSDEEDDEEEYTMKQNVFDTPRYQPAGYVLTHSDFEAIRDRAKSGTGSMREAYKAYVKDELVHDDGETPTYTDRNGDPIVYNLDANGEPYGVGNYALAFPNYRLVGEMPAEIKRDTGWVSVLMAGVHKSPFKKIKTIAIDLTRDEARAKGYIKGDVKKNEYIALMKRETDPTTIYKHQELDRDDILDMEDGWDMVAYLKREMDDMLEEEKARCILIGDGRPVGDRHKVDETRIRPVATDHNMFSIKIDINNSGYDATGDKARDFINAVVFNRKLYKGSGNPVLFIQEDMLTECLMLTDDIGHDLYPDVNRLALKLRVSRIVPVPVLEGTRYMGILFAPTDYAVGQYRGDNSNFFEDFDIDYNKHKYLKESRMSGALRKPFSAQVFYDSTIAVDTDDDEESAGDGE